MTITTRHDLGSTVFFLAANGSIKNSVVAEVISTSAPKSPDSNEARTDIAYRLQSSLGVARPEGTVFKTEKELTESLLQASKESKPAAQDSAPVKNISN